MVKTVMNNDMVLHVWAHQTQGHGRSSNGNLHFEGTVLYSYHTPIANIVDGVALVTSESYSVTTSGKHMPGYRELSGVRPWVRAPFIGAWGGMATTLDRGHSWEERHAANMAHFAAEYAKLVGTLDRQRGPYLITVEQIAAYLEEWGGKDAATYAQAFGLPAPAFDYAADALAIVEHRAAREAKRNTPQAIAKREREAKRRAEREAEKRAIERLRGEERQAAWREGKPVYLGWGENETPEGGALLRVKGDVLETSKGASVPLDHAVKVFRFIKLVRASGTPWERNGHTLRVGHFQVDRIEACGDFKAGCHFIQWAEVERIAGALGLLDVAATDAGLEPTIHAA